MGDDPGQMHLWRPRRNAKSVVAGSIPFAIARRKPLKVNHLQGFFRCRDNRPVRGSGRTEPRKKWKKPATKAGFFSLDVFSHWPVGRGPVGPSGDARTRFVNLVAAYRPSRTQAATILKQGPNETIPPLSTAQKAGKHRESRMIYGLPAGWTLPQSRHATFRTRKRPVELASRRFSAPLTTLLGLATLPLS